MTTPPISSRAGDGDASANVAWPMPARARNERATSQELPSKARRPIGSNCSAHSAGSARSTTGASARACASAGFAASSSAPNSGKYSSTASARPASSGGLRPMRSLSQPQASTSGAPIAMATPVSTVVVAASTRAMRSRK